MLKSLLVAFCMLGVCLLLPQYSFAQEVEKSKVTLNSGEVVEGTITEAIPDQYIKIKLADGTERTISTTDIKQIKTGADEAKKSSSAKAGFSAIIGFQTSFDLTSDGDYQFIEPRFIAGGKVKGIHFGAGFSYLHGKAGYELTSVTGVAEDVTMSYLPVFFNIHADVGKKKVKPSLDMSVGFPVNLNEKQYLYTLPGGTNKQYEYNARIDPGVYFQLAPGVSIQAGPVLVNVALQYQLLSFKNIIEETYIHYNIRYGTEEIFSESITTNSLGVSVNVIY